MMAPSAQRQRRPRAALSVEYLMILTFVVIPIALLVPMVMNMIVQYAGRIIWVIRSPFGWL
jgi:hypothetical protein